MDENLPSEEDNELEQLQYLKMIIDIRKKAFMQILFGLMWWLGSAIAMYFALSSTGKTYYWYGGALGSIFHWYRAFKMIRATQNVGAKTLIKNEIVLISITFLIVLVSTAKIVPEYFRVDSPTLGTCWSKADGDYLAPVACWSTNANVKTIALTNSAETCPSESTGYFDPSARESRFTCLVGTK